MGEYNIFEGYECKVIFPEKQLRTTGNSGAKKGISTLAFGEIGLVATKSVTSAVK